MDPPKEQDSDVVAWPEKTVYPNASNPYPINMPSVIRPPNKPSDFCIVDPNLKRFLLGPKIKEAMLNTSVFKNPTAVKLGGSAFVNSDYFMRKALLDAYYTDELLNCSLEFLPLLKDGLPNYVLNKFEAPNATFNFIEKEF